MKYFDIIEGFTWYSIDTEKLSEDVKQKLVKDGFDLETETSITGEYIEKYNIPYNCVTPIEFDKYECAAWLEEKIGTFPYYLVFASGYMWNGASGYKVCKRIIDTISRTCDVTIRLKDCKYKVMTCIESSHDVPTGSSTYIIGLTNDEYDRIEDMEFTEVEEFVQSLTE